MTLLIATTDYITTTGDFAEMTSAESEAFWTMYPIGFGVGIFAFAMSYAVSIAFRLVKLA